MDVFRIGVIFICSFLVFLAIAVLWCVLCTKITANVRMSPTAPDGLSSGSTLSSFPRSMTSQSSTGSATNMSMSNVFTRREWSVHPRTQTISQTLPQFVSLPTVIDQHSYQTFDNDHPPSYDSLYEPTFKWSFDSMTNDIHKPLHISASRI